MSEKRNRELGDFYFSGLLKWQTWVISKIFRAVLWVPVAALHHTSTSNDHLRTHGNRPHERPILQGFATLAAGSAHRSIASSLAISFASRVV